MNYKLIELSESKPTQSGYYYTNKGLIRFVTGTQSFYNTEDGSNDREDGVTHWFSNVIPEDFKNAAEPLMQFLAGTHPHVKALVSVNSAELLEGLESRVTDKYVK